MSNAASCVRELLEEIATGVGVEASVRVTEEPEGISAEFVGEDLGLLEFAPGRQPEIGREVAALAILSLVEGETPTANLRSPLVIHVGTRKAVQSIRPDERYSCREPLCS